MRLFVSMLFGSVFAEEDGAGRTRPAVKNGEPAKDDGPHVTKSVGSHVCEEGEDPLNINSVLEELKWGGEGKGTEKDQTVETTGDSKGNSVHEDDHGKGAEDKLPSKDGVAAKDGVAEGQKDAGEEDNMGEDDKKRPEGDPDVQVEGNNAKKGDGPEDAKDMSMEPPVEDSTEAVENPKGDCNDLATLSELFTLQRKKRNHARDKLSRACKL